MRIGHGYQDLSLILCVDLLTIYFLVSKSHIPSHYMYHFTWMGDLGTSLKMLCWHWLLKLEYPAHASCLSFKHPCQSQCIQFEMLPKSMKCSTEPTKLSAGVNQMPWSWDNFFIFPVRLKPCQSQALQSQALPESSPAGIDQIPWLCWDKKNYMPHWSQASWGVNKMPQQC